MNKTNSNEKTTAGKTIYETTSGCIRVVSPTAVDGNGIWWNGPSWDNGDYRRLITFHENRYS